MKVFTVVESEILMVLPELYVSTFSAGPVAAESSLTRPS